MASQPSKSIQYNIEVIVNQITEYRDSYTRELKSSEDVEIAHVSGQSKSLEQAIGKGRMLLSTILDAEITNTQSTDHSH